MHYDLSKGNAGLTLTNHYAPPFLPTDYAPEPVFADKIKLLGS